MIAEDETLPVDSLPENRCSDRRIAIVGAGAVGLTTAFDLASAGADVTVYEAGTVASGSSGRAAGVCYTAFAAEPNATLGTEALARFRSFAEDGAPFTPCPYVWLARAGDADRTELIRDGLERMQALGVDATELTGRTFATRFPMLRTDDVAVAGVTTDAGYTDTARYTEWLAEQARATGVTIEEQTPVAISPAQPGVVLDADSPSETTRAVDAVVVAAGAHSKQHLAAAGIQIAMKPYRVQALVGSVSVTERATDWGPMVYDTSADCYFRPHPEGLLAGNGTEEVEADPDSYERNADVGFAVDLAARVTHRLPDCALDVNRAWAGLCTATPDRDPLVGEIQSGVYVATGFQGQGFMRSPAVGRRLAGEILGAEGIEAFDPTRFDGDEEFDIREGMAIESDE